MQIMETWMCNSQENGFVLPEGIVPYTDGIARKQDQSTMCELENSYNNNDVFISGVNVMENLIFLEAFDDSKQKLFSRASQELCHRSTRIQGQLTTSASHSNSQKTASSYDEFGSKNSSSVINSDIPELSTIDLKLGSFSDNGYLNNYNPTREAETLTTLASPTPAKKIRSTSSNDQTLFCQVLDCNMDLSASKDYYKRHRVCEIHSKTAVVIVNGIQQRFCQQCSRFHLLNAFDDGKRSCRKRLAGHNERRRKPQFAINSTRIGRKLQPYHGLAFLGTTTTSISADKIRCGILQDIRYCTPNRKMRSQSREDTLGSEYPSCVSVNGQLFQTSIDSSYGSNDNFFSSYAVNATSEGFHCEYGSKCEAKSGAPSFVIDNGLPNKAFPMVSVSTCARSLLSSQSQTSFMYPREVPTSAKPLLFQDGDALYVKEPILDKAALPAGLHASTGIASGSCYSSRVNNLQDQQMNLLPCYWNNTDDINVYSSSNIHASRCDIPKHHLYKESGYTIDLLPLSSLLKNTEECRTFQVTQQSDQFNFLPNYERSNTNVKL